MSKGDGIEINNRAVLLKKGAELVEFLLESAEMEYLNIDTSEGSVIELSNGIVFIFDDLNELVDIRVD